MVNKSLLDGRASQQILAILGLLLSGFFYIFVSGILDIGAYRLFLENRLYPETPLTRVLFIYRTRNTLRTAGLFLLRQFYLLLWLLTVVGFPIMYYSYYLVPLIQAENPDIPRGELFRLSTRMMRGHRFHAFRLDLSFAGWLALSVLTFGLLRYLWLNPYLRAARVELYTELRALAKAKALPGMEHLCDEALFALPQGQPAEVYPRSLYPVPVERERKWVSIGAKERYSRLNLTLLFFLFSFIGWVWECSLEFIEFGIFVNRGTLYGPWIPIYGCGGIAILLVLNRFHRRPMLCFFLAILLCGVIEYAGATLLWELRHMRYWDYSGYFLNIQGRVCLEGLLAFGILGMVGMYVIAPLADNLLEQIPREKRRLICTVLTAGFAADFALAQVWPHTGAGITTELAHPPGRGK
jgi:hypothetical protein